MRRFIGFCIAFVALIQSSYPALAAWPQCPAAHCWSKASQVNESCRQTGSAGSPVFVEYPAGSTQLCYCPCSCVAADTPVQTGANAFEQMGQLEVGDSILALRSDGTWSSTRVGFSDGTSQPTKTLPYAIFVATANGTSLITTASHVFMLGDKSLKRADRLLPTDRLMDATSLEPTAIVRLHSGSYFGPMHNVVAGAWNENGTSDGHLINTAGVVSGDYLTQLRFEVDATTLQVGSDPYRAKYAAELLAMNGRSGAMRPLTYMPGAAGTPKTSDSYGTLVLNEKMGWKFVAYTPVEVPADAHHFLPPVDGVANPGLLNALDYTAPYDIAMSVIEKFSSSFPGVEFHLDWNSDVVNAKSYLQEDRRHVLLMGGFIRHPAVQIEAVELITSHELGHHYGGPPLYPGQWASCEGQADYWGAKDAMRKVWPGSEGPARTERGALQLNELFANGLLAGNIVARDRGRRPRANPCDHPPAQCRLDTFRAAIRLDPKPSCAGP